MRTESELIDLTKNAKTMYFVCSGNIIRSSFAELLARNQGVENVDSYGTTYHNSSIHDRSQQELVDRGVDSKLIDQFKLIPW